jgi:hypothetical protein
MRSVLSMVMVLALLVPMAQAEEKARTFTSRKEFGQWAQTYYRDPQPQLVESALKFAVADGLWSEENTRAPTRAVFSCLFARHPDRQPAWNKAIAALDEAPREFFRSAMEVKPMQLLAETPVSPARNDMVWGCFFVTGDERYAQEVIATMRHLGERKNLELYLAAASAQWSLASIAQGDANVRAALQVVAAGADAELAAASKEALEKPLSELRDAATRVLREQKEAGVW